MCGIVGVIGPNASRSLVERMCSTIVHRGPDSEGFYVRPGVALGMRRLSIIDLTSGDQPIHNEDRTVWTVYNGEIYNSSALRKDLEERGHRFYTKSDTELLVHCYEEFGTDLCVPLRGMFAFALWDETKRRLVVARDRVGKKPLYHTQVGETLLIASEIKSLLSCPEVPRRLDPLALNEYLTLGYVPGPRTMFDGIRKLLPGHIMVFSQGRLHSREYWDLSAQQLETPNCELEEDWLHWLEFQLEEAVRLRLISDVPLGAFLSGGLDSSLVVGMMRRHVTGPLKTFSVAFDESEEYDERRHARTVAQHFETDHYELVVRDAPVELLQKIAWHFDEPVADEAALPTFLLSRLARQHVKVVLTGEGADELFAGYGQYHYVNRLSELQSHLPRFITRAGRLALALSPEDGRGGIWLDRARKALSGLSESPAESYYRYGHITTAYFRNSLYSESLKRSLRSDPAAIADGRRAYFDKVAACDALSQALYLDIKTWLPDRLLMKVDKMAMANSLEARAPYLDHLLVQGVFRMPVNLKMRQNDFKYILRRLGQTMLPDSIWRRPKHGFLVPYREWFAGPLKPFVYNTLSPERLRDHAMFTERGIRNLLSDYFDHRKQQEGNTRTLWALLCFQLWYEKFLRPGKPSPSRECCAEENANFRAASTCSALPAR